MDKSDIAAILAETGEILEILGENPFKVRAHLNAARVIESFDQDIKKLAAAGELTKIKGIGKGIAEKIEIILATGALPELAELHAKVPDGVLRMLKIPGLGPKKVKAIWEKLGATTLGELEYACNENRLAELAGFGAKSQEKVLKGIETVTKFAERRLLPEAMASADETLAWILKEKSVTRAQVAGSVRRAKETVKDIDIVACSSQAEKVMDHFVKAPDVIETISKGPTKSSVRLTSGIQADLRVVADREFPYALHHFTGSREHNTLMRGLAKSKGMKMNEYGLFEGDKLVPCRNEEEIFKALGLSYIPPELREGMSEIDDAAKGDLPPLITEADIAGIFHCHTVYSDGKNSIEEMAIACMETKYKYLGVSDHSQSAPYAGGLTEDDLKRQIDEIDQLNEKFDGFRLFKGVESDILTNGALDYPDKVLEKLDFVIASVHSGFNMDERKMTDRIVAAVKNPYTTMLGHPTGRLLLAREPYAVDMIKVIDACAKHTVIIELNANPHRLDIDWRMMRKAKADGVKISINPDAHRVAGLKHTMFGIMIARKGGLGKEDVFNTQSASDIAKEFAARRKA